METSDYFTPASRDVLLASMKRLKEAFPLKNDAFFEILVERIIANGFTDAEVVKITENALDTILHNNPTPGEIIYEAKRKREEKIVE
jgi:hypothetical protein